MLQIVASSAYIGMFIRTLLGRSPIKIKNKKAQDRAFSDSGVNNIWFGAAGGPLTVKVLPRVNFLEMNACVPEFHTIPTFEKEEFEVPVMPKRVGNKIDLLPSA